MGAVYRKSVQRGDVCLNYTVHGSGDWVVLIGGLAGGNWQSWRGQLPKLTAEAGETSLPRSRNVRYGREARAGRYGERPHSARAYVRQGRRQPDKVELNVAREDCGDGSSAALVGHVRHLRPGALLRDFR